jgi:D-sedoheptulose 7-phosphate isomerase
VDDASKIVVNFLDRSARIFEVVARDPKIVSAIVATAGQVNDVFARGGKVMLIGNGGSAADAQHLAAEFLSRFVSNRRPLPALALTTDTSVLTAIGNDFAFVDIFARQIQGLARPGDMLFALSTSGNSPNVLAGLDAARVAKVVTVGLTGKNGGRMPSLCDACIQVPTDETAIIQQVHIAIGHAICSLVEASLKSPGGPDHPASARA